MIDDITIKKVKDAANIVDVISDFYQLKRDGPNYTCLCPFHQDRTLGSFKISKSKNMFTCYSCGEHGGPVDFLMKHENMPFKEAIAWLGKKYGIDVEGSDKYQVRACRPHTPPPPLPMLTLPESYVANSRHHLDDNTLVKWLRSLRWTDQQRDMLEKNLKNYLVGHGKNGHAIFWQVDERGQIRTGKMMLYKPDGHRDRESWGNFNYIHSLLYRTHILDPMEKEYKTCYFGQHMLDIYPTSTVNIVESEKTALICATAYGDPKKHLWIASGGLNFLNREKLKPFIERNRHIVLYPDRDGIEQWREKMKAIGYERIYLNTEIVTRYWKEEDGQKADIADIIVRMIQPTTKEKMLEEMAAENPALQQLINAFDLSIK